MTVHPVGLVGILTDSRHVVHYTSNEETTIWLSILDRSELAQSVELSDLVRFLLGTGRRRRGAGADVAETKRDGSWLVKPLRQSSEPTLPPRDTLRHISFSLEAVEYWMREVEKLRSIGNPVL